MHQKFFAAKIVHRGEQSLAHPKGTFIIACGAERVAVLNVALKMPEAGRMPEGYPLPCFDACTP